MGDAPLAVRATAPHRVCDNGGWSDTWFAGEGRVCNLAVEPAVQVDVLVQGAAASRDRPPVTLDVGGERYEMVVEDPPGRHPLVEACVAAGLEAAGGRAPSPVEVVVRSAMPPGAATGTSAAVAVATLAAWDRIAGRDRPPSELALAAHRVETERLGLQSGVQDQLAAAHGGACWIEIDRYPNATVTVLPVGRATWAELDRRLVLVYLGRPHRSSAVHDLVIAELERRGGDSPVLDGLRQAATQMRDALLAGDLEALGRALVRNTDLQAELHPGLVGTAARAVIDAAARAGASGWKVNGAGGEGGSVTVLCGPEPGEPQRLLERLGEQLGVADGGDGGDGSDDPSGVVVVPARLRAEGVQVHDR